MKRAWRVRLVGVETIVAATTRGRAIALTVRSAQDANYACRFPDAKCRRAPEHDGWAALDASNACWQEQYLPAPAAAAPPAG